MISFVCKRATAYPLNYYMHRRMCGLTSLAEQTLIHRPTTQSDHLRLFSFPYQDKKRLVIIKQFQSQFFNKKVDSRALWKWSQLKYPHSRLTPINKSRKESIKTLKQSKFSSSINEIFKLKSCYQISTLEKFIFDESVGGIKRFDILQIKQIVKILNNLKAYDLLVEVVERCSFKELRRLPVHVLSYCNANLKSCYINPNKVVNLINSILLKTSPDSEQYPIDEAYEIKALAHVYKCDLAKKTFKMLRDRQIKPDTLESFIQFFNVKNKSFSSGRAFQYYKKELDLSIKAFEKALECSFDSKYRLSLIYQLLEAANTTKAKEVGEAIFFEFLEEGAHVEDLTHQEVKTILIGAILANSSHYLLEPLAERLLHTCQNKSHQEEAMESLILIGQNIQNSYIQQIITKLSDLYFTNVKSSTITEDEDDELWFPFP